jgi:hypothetical protein
VGEVLQFWTLLSGIGFVCRVVILSSDNYLAWCMEQNCCEKDSAKKSNRWKIIYVC